MKLHYDISAWDIFGAAASMVIARLLAKVDFPEAYAISCGPGAVGLVRRTGVALDRAKPAQIWQKIDPAHRSALEPLFPAEALARERREPVDRSEGSRPRRPSSHWRRGIERRLIFRDDADRDDFIDRFGAVFDDTQC